MWPSCRTRIEILKQMKAHGVIFDWMVWRIVFGAILVYKLVECLMFVCVLCLVPNGFILNKLFFCRCLLALLCFVLITILVEIRQVYLQYNDPNTLPPYLEDNTTYLWMWKRKLEIFSEIYLDEKWLTSLSQIRFSLNECIVQYKVDMAIVWFKNWFRLIDINVLYNCIGRKWEEKKQIHISHGRIFWLILCHKAWHFKWYHFI